MRGKAHVKQDQPSSCQLRPRNQEVEIAHDGVAAVDAVLSAQAAGALFDLVLMDIQMPGCDGYAATRTIRASGIAPEELPIVALTANAYPEDIAAALEAGMQAHLAKPLVFEDLAAALARWLPVHIVEEGGDRAPASAATLREPPRSEALDERWAQRRREAIEAQETLSKWGRRCYQQPGPWPATNQE